VSNKLPFELTLYDNCLQANNSPIMRVTNQIGNTWRRSIRSIGGYWIGEAEFEGSVGEMDDIFRDGLMWEIRETWGGYQTWQGFLAKMNYKRNGVTYTRDWGEIANKIKMKYKQTTPQLLTNTSVETDAWAEEGDPLTCVRSTAWKTHGDYSMYIVSDDVLDGCIVATGVEVAAGTKYTFSVDYNIIRGFWRLLVYTEEAEPRYVAGSSTNVIATNHEGKAIGTIEADNVLEYSGTVRLIFIDTTTVRGGMNMEAYVDNASFRGGMDDASTSWTEDADSQSVYGTIEEVFTRKRMTEDAANALVASELIKRAYPNVLPPSNLYLEPEKKDNSLELIFYGYNFTLANKYSQLVTLEDEVDTTTCTTVVTDELAASEYITAGEIDTNATLYESDSSSEETRQWEVFRQVAETGDTSGNRWEIGVLYGRKLYYRQVSETIKARIRGGIVYDQVGAPVEPWLVEPGYYLIEDMPIDYQHMSGLLSRNPRVVYMDEVEFNAADWIKGKQGLTFSKNR